MSFYVQLTEGNLADGFFKFNDFQKKMGKWCIGSDSHIGLSPFEEIRLLDYGVRLQTNSRKTFKSHFKWKFRTYSFKFYIF